MNKKWSDMTQAEKDKIVDEAWKELTGDLTGMVERTKSVVSVQDENGNYRYTYDILADLAEYCFKAKEEQA